MKLPPWIFILGGIGLATLLFVAGGYTGVMINDAKWVKDVAAQNAKAQKVYKELQEKTDVTIQNMVDDLSAVTGQRDAALKRLRDREARKPEATRTNCKGASGAELSGEDAAFLTGFAAECDRCAVALNGCYGYADGLQD